MQFPIDLESGSGVDHLIAELARLRAENALYRALAESAADIVSVLSLTGEVRKAFRTRLRHMGYDPDELVGSSFLDLVHPEDHEAAMGALAEAQQPSAVVTRALRLRHKDGQFLEFECTARNRAHDPDVQGIIVHCQDVSDRRVLERRVQLAERMEAVGRLASGVAHDFNNILAIIELSAARALMQKESAHAQLQQIQRATERASSLIKRLLSFAGAQPQPPTSADLCRLTNAMAETLRTLLPESITLQIVTPSERCYAMVDVVALEQVLLNLVLNARDAIADHGQIELSVARRTSPGSGHHHAEEYIVISVRDDGTGMDEPTRNAALEPFFTTKAVGRGTGLGLWTVQDFAQKSNGVVFVDSQPGNGTLVELMLPLVNPQRRRRISTPVAPPRLGRRMTILLAEDEPALRNTIAELLRDMGHNVLTACDGEEALVVANDLSQPFDALVTDLTMPRLGGIDLAVHVRQRRPGVALLFMTGYGETADIEERFPKSRLLRKPFAAQVLMDALSRLLPE